MRKTFNFTVMVDEESKLVRYVGVLPDGTSLSSQFYSDEHPLKETLAERLKELLERK